MDVAYGVEVRIEGGGLSGSGWPVYPFDFSGSRFGSSVRSFISDLPVEIAPPLDSEKYDNWFCLEKPFDKNLNRTIARLYRKGLIWRVFRYLGGSDTEYQLLCALTPKGGLIRQAVSEQLAAGKAIRWSTLNDVKEIADDGSLSSVSRYLSSYCLTEGVESVSHIERKTEERFSRRSGEKPPYLFSGYGNSREYLFKRLARYDCIWGSSVECLPVVAEFHKIEGRWHCVDESFATTDLLSTD